MSERLDPLKVIGKLPRPMRYTIYGGAAGAAALGGAIASRAAYEQFSPGQEQYVQRINLELPKASSETWWLTSGPHFLPGDTGIRSAIDLTPTEKGVPCDDGLLHIDSRFARSVAEGEVIYARQGLVKVRHSDGLISLYVHVANLQVKKGNRVSQGQEIGSPSCASIDERGSPSGVHLHLGFEYQGRRVPIKDLVISGWRVVEGVKAYDGWLINGEEVRTAIADRCGPSDESINSQRCGGLRNDFGAGEAAGVSVTPEPEYHIVFDREFASGMVEEINRIRALRRVSPLQQVQSLLESAQGHAADYWTEDDLEAAIFDGSDNESPQTIASKHGYTGKVEGDVSLGHFESGSVSPKNFVHNSWGESYFMDAVLLLPEFRDIGIACFRQEEQGAVLCVVHAGAKAPDFRG